MKYAVAWYRLCHINLQVQVVEAPCKVQAIASALVAGGSYRHGSMARLMDGSKSVSGVQVGLLKSDIILTVSDSID